MRSLYTLFHFIHLCLSLHIFEKMLLRENESRVYLNHLLI